MPPKSANISKFKKTLKSPVLIDTNATFNKKLTKKLEESLIEKPSSPRSPSPRSPSPRSPSPRSPSPRSPKASPSRSPKASPSRSPKASPSRSPKGSPRPVSRVPTTVPGVITEETIESRFIVERPSVEKYANRDIIKQNPKVTTEELSIILGVTKVILPKIDTNIAPVPFPKVKPSSPKTKSPRSPSSKSPKASPVKKSCNIMLGDKPIDKSMISAGKKSGNKPVYSMAELKQIAIQLNISATGVKDTIVSNILKELEKRGC